MTKTEVPLKPRPKRGFLFAFLVLFTLSFACLFEVFFPSVQLNINQNMWETDRPATYFMKVRQRDGNGWRHWKTIVSDENILKATVDVEVQTVDQIFSLLASGCAPRGFMECNITFNPQFHYPTTALSYEGFYIEIEQFMPCDNDVEACISAMEAE